MLEQRGSSPPAELLVGQELDRGVGDDAHAVRPIAPEHAPDALRLADVLQALCLQQYFSILCWGGLQLDLKLSRIKSHGTSPATRQCTLCRSPGPASGSSAAPVGPLQSGICTQSDIQCVCTSAQVLSLTSMHPARPLSSSHMDGLGYRRLACGTHTPPATPPAISDFTMLCHDRFLGGSRSFPLPPSALLMLLWSRLLLTLPCPGLATQPGPLTAAEPS